MGSHDPMDSDLTKDNRKRPLSTSSSSSDLDTYSSKRSFTNLDLVHLIMSSDQINLRKENPVIIKNFIDDTCGNVTKVFPGRDDVLNIYCTRTQANLLLVKKVLNGKSIKVVENKRGQYIKGIIHGVSVDLEDDTLKELQAPGFDIKDSYRIKNKQNPTKSVVISFKGNTLPERVMLGYWAFTVHTFIPRPTRCFKCQRFGHQAKFCKSKARCSKCGGEHPYEDCQAESYKCCNCGGEHSAAYNKCPQYVTTQEVVRVKTVSKVTYAEAVNQVKAKQALNTQSHLPQTSANPPEITEISGPKPRPPVISMDTEKLANLTAGLFHLHNEGKLREQSLSDLVKNVVCLVNQIYNSDVKPETVFKAVSKCSATKG